jgi:hypothetical protein
LRRIFRPRCKDRADDRRVLSGIIQVTRNGLSPTCC